MPKKEDKGYLTYEDIRSIWGLRTNPLMKNLVMAMFREEGPGREDASLDVVQIPFTSFCKAFAHFKTKDRAHTAGQKYCNTGGKLEFMFKVMDAR